MKSPSAESTERPVSGSLLVEALVDSAVEVDRMIARFTALRAEVIDAARQAAGHSGFGAASRNSRGQEILRRSFRAEIATSLRIPERAAETLIAVSEALTHDLPNTLDALRGGTISYPHAHRIVDAAAFLPESDTKDRFERTAVAIAEETTAATLARRLRPLSEKLRPETLTERHTRALDERDVRMDSGCDGMGWLNAYLPIVDVTAIFGRLTDAARSLRGSDESRTLAQLRADVLRDVLLDDPPVAEEPVGRGDSLFAGGTGADDDGVEGDPAGDGDAADASVRDSGAGDRTGVVLRYRGIRPRVYLTVPVLTLLGHGDEPATLEGYGPIDPRTARELTARAPSFTRILTHPETGAVLSVGRTSYVVPSDLRTWLRIRDSTCRFPGCNQPVTACDVDHSLDWQANGLTAHDNLAHLCRGHHTMKHYGGWAVRHTADATLVWTSPAGRRHITHPETRVPAAKGPPPRHAPPGREPSESEATASADAADRPPF
jgi:hypothetical protein